MADHTAEHFDPALLDHALGKLDADADRALQLRLADEPRLAAQHAKLAPACAALAAERSDTPLPRAGLEERIRRRVASVRPVRAAAADPDDGPVIIRLQTFRDIAAVAAVIVLAIGLGIPGMLEMRERAQRIVCSDHLARVGTGLQQYALESNDRFPFVGFNTASSWRPTTDPEVQHLPNRRHMYPLLAAGHVAPPQFICPATDGVPMRSELVDQRNDFVEARNVSFAYQNMVGIQPTLESNPELPILGDDNPLFDNGLPLFDAIRRLHLGDARDANSRAHGGGGQNILTRGGNVRWITSPNGGIDGDNIWTIQNIDEYTGREGPANPEDAHLLR